MIMILFQIMTLKHQLDSTDIPRNKLVHVSKGHLVNNF